LTFLEKGEGIIGFYRRNSLPRPRIGEWMEQSASPHNVALSLVEYTKLEHAIQHTDIMDHPSYSRDARFLPLALVFNALEQSHANERVLDNYKYHCIECKGKGQPIL